MKLRDDSIEKYLVVALIGFAAVLFFTQTGISLFGLMSIGVMLYWRFSRKHEPVRTLPKLLVVFAVLYVVSYLLGAILSENLQWAFTELRKYRHLLLGGLLFTAPISSKNRKIIITVFFLASALAGFIGILQYFDIMHKGYDRPHGWSPNPVLYAEMLALVCGSAIIMLFVSNTGIYRTVKERIFLVSVVMLTSGGVLFSQARGVWVALLFACAITLILYDKRKAAIFIIAFVILSTAVFSLSDSLKQRAISIITSVHTESSTGSTGTRLELWKGALLIFRKSPILGTGIGDFEGDIKKLVHDQTLDEVNSTVYAHNIFMQALATRGIIGFFITCGLFIALLQWGVKEIRTDKGVGGYIIILSTLLTLIGGLTDNITEISKYLAAYCFTLGALGTLRLKERPAQDTVF